MERSIDPATRGAETRPFFIVGCPRSGTTLLSVLLDRHSKIAVTPETSFYDDTSDWPWPCDRTTLARRLSDWSRLPDLALDPNAIAAACPPRSNPAEVLATILALYAEACGKAICGEKTPQHLRHAERIVEDFPDSLILCLLRDGRDAVFSLAAMPWWTSDLRGAAQCWLEAVEQARRLSAVHPGRFVVVRYEELVTDTEQVLGAILRRLGLDFEARQLVDAGIGATRLIRPRSYAWKGRAAGPIDPARIGSRRAEAGAEALALVEAMLGPALDSLGYRVDDPEPPISAAAASPSDPSQAGVSPEIGRGRTVVERRPRPWHHRTGIAAAASPRLTVSIMTRDSADRLGRLIDEVSCFADEIVVGVDAASSDRTLEIASDLADKVYRFAHPPSQLSGARMLIFRYASGDWILSLDDDESIGDEFDAILPELLSDPVVTNVWFPRQWIVDRASFTYLHKPPWYPDWQLRLFRNDESLVWKPAKAHSGFYVQGQSRLEPRAVIHHFEPVLLDADARARKLAAYRTGGSVEASELQYVPLADQRPRVSATPRRGVAPRARGQSFAVVASEIQTPPIRETPDWRCRVLGVEMAPALQPDDGFAAEVWVRNTGFHAWMPDTLSLRGSLIRLSYHLLSAEGHLLKQDNLRVPVPQLVRPGEAVMIILQDRAPAEPGRYIFEWDLVSELEAWFGDLGSPTYRTLVEVE